LLTRLVVSGFKSLGDVDVGFPQLTVLFGPNAAGKSNLLDAVQALSRIGTSRTLSDALSEPIRGYPIEAFGFPPGGLPQLLSQDVAGFTLEADVQAGREGRERFRYRVAVEIQPKSGSVVVRDEHLVALSAKGEPKGAAAIEKEGDYLLLRRKSHPGRPRKEPIGQNYAMLSDQRLGGAEWRSIERVRSELSSWRTYYLDPRVAMRSARPPADAFDIGVLGDAIAPFLYRLRAERPEHFQAVKRTLRSLIPSVEDLSVDLDEKRSTLDIHVRQGGRDFSSRIISEGTLRVLALCAIAVNPWGGPLLAFEEPENGVHPRRLELIAQLLASLTLDRSRQLIVTSHSPLFCDAILKQSRSRPGDIALLNVRDGRGGTVVTPFDVSGPLFRDHEIAQALTSATEDGLFESLMLRGLIDE
jgi:predicted ATPase